MIKRTAILIYSLFVLLLGCTTSKKAVESHAAIPTLMAQRNFEMQIRSAEPQVTQAMAQIANSGFLPPGNTIGRIDVTGQGFFIRVKGDSVSANLPYFGERQMGGGFGDNPGITFNTVPEKLEITKDEGKKRYQIKFTANTTMESLGIYAEVSENGSGTASIRSSHRNRIRYSGRVVALKE